MVPPTPQAVEPATAAKELSVATPSSLQAARKASASTPTTAAKEKAGYKVPEVSQFDDLMSRIKGAMNAPAPPKTPTPRIADNAETVSTSHSSPRGDVPTVKLPAPSASAVAPNSSNVPTPAPSPPILTSKPPVPTEPRSTKPAATTNGGAQSEPRGREVQPRKVSTRAAFESREALPLFERTRAARPPSPTPAWKRYSVQLSSSAQVAPRRPPSLPSLKLFHSTHSPAKVNILSWNPPIVNLSTRRMSRDDLFFPKKYVRGKVICPVKMPSKRIEKRKDIELVERKVRMAKAVAEEKKAPKDEGKEVGQGLEEAASQEGMVDGSGRAPTPRGRGRGRAPEQGLWRRESPLPSPAAIEVDQLQSKELGAAAAEDAPGELDSTTAPPAAELFNTSPSQPRESKMGAASIAFYRSADGGRPSPLERSFMVTSELNGEVVNMGPRESLAAPGADRSSSASMVSLRQHSTIDERQS